MRIRSTLTLLTAVCIAAAMAVSAAFAHTEISSTSPGRGGKAKTSIHSVKVTFSQQIRSGSLRVTGPGNKVVSLGGGGRDPRNVKRLAVSLKGSLKAGKYRASWKIVAADGHKQHGSFSFRLHR
jgi:copper resistance protein C